ncbi:hypothetical protein [Streptomyces sp. NPDC060194]|uniref:hypothetical protein n=1 Tax=Streptomyces sp. NPDC060194 TaxID=3347069 RepID=UPI00365412A9
MSNQPHEPYEHGQQPYAPQPPYDPSWPPPAPQSWDERTTPPLTWPTDAWPGPGSGDVPQQDRRPYDVPVTYGAQASHNGQGPHEAPDPYGARAPYPHPGDGYAHAAAPQDPQSPYVPPQLDRYDPHTVSAPIPPEAPVSAPTAPPRAPLTAAQRARAEGRSPIIAPGLRPAALTAVLAALLAGGAALGSWALLLPLLALQAVTAAGWFRLNGMWPARQGIALAFLGGVVADGVLLAVGREHAPAAIIGTLGVWVLLTIVLQLRNRAPADERMYGLTATVASAALAVLAAGHLGAEPDAVVVGAVAVGVAALVRALPLPGVVAVVAALLAGAGSGIATGSLTGVGAQGALLALGAAGCALIGLRVASYDYPSRFVHMTAGVALPLALAAPAVYLLGRVVV